VYAEDEPPAGYGLETEIDGVFRAADASRFERFHLVGYSGGGAVSASLVARHPDRVLSLSLLEPAWIGNEDQSEGERRAWEELHRLRELPPGEMMSRFVRTQLAPGVEPPAPPPGPTPPWMAGRPAGIRALTGAFERHHLDLTALGAYERPVLYVLGGRSNPDYFGSMARRLGGVFGDYRLEVFPERHHFDPPHRAEPGRLASALLALWDRSAAPGTAS
jgi:pimeloyl-ACP methyl ester carboxylesterase